ncbi:alpha-amylase family glycosyl hydrolase [Mycoplasmopsis cynos]|uniref:alpha-amylase family glycosyl hydrolase n=3 Tax=Mycoplasmopsis cynos TaxID=171284 RepID=UPI0022000F9C|nr:alpha-amylase family glycosyl hydrolase [Mycoplasmopsis cynos]UWV82172.1 alpha-amylase family glycosyl hydrolase [Mycoplasmopsis cynos]
MTHLIILVLMVYTQLMQKIHIARIEEFKNFVDLAHKNGIGIILDVVYNHMMDNHILDDVVPTIIIEMKQLKNLLFSHH